MKGRFRETKMPRLRANNHSLPFQVAAVCYRQRESSVDFLLVNTNGSGKWTFPKGSPGSHISHGEAAEREALEEAGAIGTIQPRHFQLYIHSKGVFWKSPGVQEFVVKAFLLEVRELRRPHEPGRNPTWFSAEDAKKVLAKGRERKYSQELSLVIDRALEQIQRNPTVSQNGSKRLAKVPAGVSGVLNR
jgi:8-oxo-dGTP pyrophosphatase MutT (NUDIX family)